MNSNSVQSPGGNDGTRVCLPIPLGDPDVFTHDATADVLHVLADNPEKSFSNRQLRRLTGKGLGNVNGAVHSLESLGVVTVDREGRANQVRIDPQNLVRSDDPVTAIPQTEYQDPVRRIREVLVERVGEDAGIVLFGSVARGEADRVSDIDLFVVVDDGRMDAQRAAHSVEADVGSERFDGDRYEPHIVVETPDGAVRHDRIHDVLTEGITLRETPALTDVKREVASSGA